LDVTRYAASAVGALMTIPDYQTLMLPVLLAAAKGERRVPEVANELADAFDLSTDEREQMLPSGRQRVLYNRIHWAKSYMAKAGLIDTPVRGRFTASAAGKALLATNPDRIDVTVLMKQPGFLEFYTGGQGTASEEEAPGGASRVGTSLAAPSAENPAATPEEQIEVAHQSMQSALRSDLLERITQNSPYFFERLIVELLVAMGYGGSYKDAARQLGRTGDGGVDGVVNEDPLGLDRVYVQAKRYSDNSVGRPDVQAFVGSLVGLGASKGVFVTTSTFSAQARDFARHLPQRVILIDGEQLTELMVEHGVGVRTSRSISFKRIDEDFFTEED
jgi:restriction system protein